HDTHTLFAGLHGEHQLNRAAVQFGLTAGHSWIDHNRFVNDNLASLGESWVSADYGGFFVSPELALSTDILLENGMTLTPNAGLRYAAQWLGGYAETGAVSPAANATVADRFVGTVEARAGLDITRSFEIRGRTGTLTGGIGYLGRWGGGDDDASITLNGVTQSVASGHQDLNAVMVSATLLSDIGETGFLELDANYLVGDTAQGFDGRLTMGMAF
ncbi:MAG: autotransporter outer membrane beta-barrel domain-containing protein, partial [Oceanococcus sp.]